MAAGQVGLGERLRNVLGDKTAAALEKAFGMRTVDDLLKHYPRRYVELGALTDLSHLEVGAHATILVRVESAKNYSFGPGGRRTRTEVVVTDGNARVTLTFFQQPWRVGSMKPDTVGLAAGEVSSFNGRLQLTHPDFEPVGGEGVEDTRLGRGLIPLYRATAKIASWKIETFVALCLDALGPLDDPLPDEVRATHGFPDQRTAYELIHRPRANEDWQRARDRFRFEEAFVVQTIFAQRRRVLDEGVAVARPPVAGRLHDTFAASLPFTLTDGQRTVTDEIASDLARAHPMHRLLQGEVGSGKTVVALLAMLQVVDAGGQAALLAPTEVLAAQHYRAITQMLGDLASSGTLSSALLDSPDVTTRVRLLTGSQGAKARRAALLDAQSGEAGIVVGTHALIQDTVQFAELGLLVVDEQHRFGVEQRAALADRSEVKPHVLVMTATPIPRTVAMTVFGDLEVSTLRELPAGRQPIQSTVVPADNPTWMSRVWQRVREEVSAGRQAYVVVSRIGDAAGEGTDPDGPETRSLLDLHAELVDGPLSDLRVGMLHGRMNADDKDASMLAFAAAEVDVLVATTVVEVGVDVPNATVMVIMDAERFGVSQLHQLRGRVGRGGDPGLCLLVTHAEAGSPSHDRLVAVADTSDGFELSMLDVRLRSEGDVLGASQSGVRSSLRLLSVVRHEKIITEARTLADGVVASDPGLSGFPALAAAVAELEATEAADYLDRT